MHIKNVLVLFLEENFKCTCFMCNEDAVIHLSMTGLSKGICNKILKVD